ncbi:MAG TPA: isoprenylcysteine carboxylmethyltransferase family protein [Terracidiphilus sp.]|nr:isoprenylcysteine carboxylmethyltransferase family protein [Terracidiphilus sp.]
MASQVKHAVISILFVVVGGPAILLVYLPYWLTGFRIPAGEPRWQFAIACAFIGVGIVPLLESATRFIRVGKGTLLPTNATEHLVVSGAYRYVRNPMYVGVLTSLAAEAALFRSTKLIVELIAAIIAAHVFVCLYEEPTLARRYGQDYAAFKRNVPRWLPRITPWVDSN